MFPLEKPLDRFAASFSPWLTKHGVTLLRISLGIVFLWFGALKLVPGMSPAEGLAGKTIAILTFGWLRPETAVFILAVWECLIGLGLVTGRFLDLTSLLLGVQMLGTLTPLVLFPHECFSVVPFVPTFEGQYILKNMVLISAGLVIWSTARRERDSPED